MKPAANGANRDIQDLGNLLVFTTLDFTQDHHRPVFRRELPEGLVDLVDQFAVQNPVLGLVLGPPYLLPAAGTSSLLSGDRFSSRPGQLHGRQR